MASVNATRWRGTIVYLRGTDPDDGLSTFPQADSKLGDPIACRARSGNDVDRANDRVVGASLGIADCQTRLRDLANLATRAADRTAGDACGEMVVCGTGIDLDQLSWSAPLGIAVIHGKHGRFSCNVEVHTAICRGIPDQAPASGACF